MTQDSPADLRKLCRMLYGIFAASAFLQFSMVTVVFAGLVLLVAVYLASVKRKAAAGTPYESHLAWLVRTFWIGGGVYLPVLTVLATTVLMQRVDTGDLMNKMAESGVSDPAAMEEMLTREYGGTVLYTTLIFTVPFTAWWLYRCWRGYTLLKRDAPVENVTRWY